MNFKKLFSLLLSITMVVTGIPAVSFADMTGMDAVLSATGEIENTKTLAEVQEEQEDEAKVESSVPTALVYNGDNESLIPEGALSLVVENDEIISGEGAVETTTDTSSEPGLGGTSPEPVSLSADLSLSGTLTLEEEDETGTQNDIDLTEEDRSKADELQVTQESESVLYDSDTENNDEENIPAEDKEDPDKIQEELFFIAAEVKKVPELTPQQAFDKAVALEKLLTEMMNELVKADIGVERQGLNNLAAVFGGLIINLKNPVKVEINGGQNLTLSISPYKKENLNPFGEMLWDLRTQLRDMLQAWAADPEKIDPKKILALEEAVQTIDAAVKVIILLKQIEKGLKEALDANSRGVIDQPKINFINTVLILLGGKEAKGKITDKAVQDLKTMVQNYVQRVLNGQMNPEKLAALQVELKRLLTDINEGHANPFVVRGKKVNILEFINAIRLLVKLKEIKFIEVKLPEPKPQAVPQIPAPAVPLKPQGEPIKPSAFNTPTSNYSGLMPGSTDFIQASKPDKNNPGKTTTDNIYIVKLKPGQESTTRVTLDGQELKILKITRTEVKKDDAGNKYSIYVIETDKGPYEVKLYEKVNGAPHPDYPMGIWTKLGPENRRVD